MRLVWLLLLSLGLGLGGLYLATREELFSAALYAPTELTPALAALALACLLALWLAPVAKLVLLARSQGQRLGWWHAFVAHVAQVFGTAMTPAGTGGAPFLVVALGEVGVPSGVGLALAVQLFVLDLAALGVLILLGLGYLLLASPVVLGPLLAVTAGVASSPPWPRTRSSRTAAKGRSASVAPAGWSSSLALPGVFTRRRAGRVSAPAGGASDPSRASAAPESSTVPATSTAVTSRAARRSAAFFTMAAGGST